jgi:hypothetical protein
MSEPVDDIEPPASTPAASARFFWAISIAGILAIFLLVAVLILVAARA